MSSPVLDALQLNRATLARQGLLEPITAGSLPGMVARLGSLQAQHPDWPPFALRTRLDPRHDGVDLLVARRRREVVRASLMRMTVHVVAADDFWPMSTLTLGGMVAGTWLPRRDDVSAPRVELRPFGRLRRADRDALEAEAERLIPVLHNGAFSRVAGTD